MSKFPDLIGTLASFFQLGKGGAGLRSNSGRIEARNAPNNAYADFQCETIYIGGARVTYSSNVPVSPAAGDLWMETSSGVPKYGWTWYWDGTYWLSPDQKIEFEAKDLAAPANRYFAPDPLFNYYFRSFVSSAYVATTNNASNYWGFNVIRLTTTVETTIFTAGTTGTNTVNNWSASARQSIATHVNVVSASVQQFAVGFLKTGSPGLFYGSITLIYNYARR